MKTLRELMMVIRSGIWETIYEEDRTDEITTPFYVVFKGDEVIGKTELSMPTTEMNKFLRDAVAEACDRAEVTRFFHISEAYQKQLKVEEYEAPKDVDEDGLGTNTPSLRHDPASVEVLVMYGGDRDGSRVMGSWRLRRDETTEETFFEEQTVMEWNVNVPDPLGSTATTKWDLWDRPSLRKLLVKPVA